MGSIKSLPHDLETEQSVLSACMLGGVDDIVNILNPDDFYASKHQAIFRAIQSLYHEKDPVDLNMVADKLRALGELEKASVSYISNLVDKVPAAGHAEYHAGIIKKHSIRRSIIERINEISKKAYNDSISVEGLLDEVQSRFTDLSLHAAKNQCSSYSDLAIKLTDRLNSPEGLQTAIPTALSEVDNSLGGLFNGDLGIIAARPGCGKSALMGNFAYGAALAGYPALIFSLEMTAMQLFNRQIARMAQVNVSKFRQPKYFTQTDHTRIAEALQKAYEIPVYIDDTPYLPHMELIRRARKIHRKHGIKLVLVDYLQLIKISIPNRTRDNEIGEITKSLKALAKELSVPVVLLSQLNRQIEYRKDPTPTLADLRDSGNVEQDADWVGFLFKDPELGDERRWFLIAKHRQGKPIKVKLRWVGYTTSFENE